ncbi:hypothetical protein K503DRAFT_339652 [Rhizopogon vinicolor AM-OR11-026]|uniref:Uncharacterized protein n=1 Tax=Rhizopogon vinicolor AM-OR11-026 TaxID=1314800 RepID=A0A1B7MTI6_9AGAM|nr:hypothetical protein K503DRAFT_339652 [Rhizopogon vinicolor AM-OR11-026]
MHELSMDAEDAMPWVVDLYKEIEKEFLEAITALPKWGEPRVDSQVRQYCGHDGVANWVRGNYEWRFESERYSGSGHRGSRNQKGEMDYADTEGPRHERSQGG